MAEKKEPAKKKRRIRPSAPTTVRQQAEKAKLNSKKEKKPRYRRINAIIAKLGPVGRFLAKVFRPIRWLFRHLVPKYFKNSFRELRLVTWPNFKQSRQLTTAVILFAAVFGFLITILDTGLEKVFKKVFLKE